MLLAFENSSGLVNINSIKTSENPEVEIKVNILTVTSTTRISQIRALFPIHDCIVSYDMLLAIESMEIIYGGVNIH